MPKEIPIFDSLSHPTISGKWLSKNLNSKFDSLSNSLKENNYLGAFAVGIHKTEGYEHEKFKIECDKYKNLYAIAGINIDAEDINKEIKLIKDLGYIGIKIHPRFNNLKLEKHNLVEIINLANKNGLYIFYCTYFHQKLNNIITVDLYLYFIEIMKKCKNAKVILLHGGDVNLLKYAELVRFNDNLLLDLSLTIFKYQMSSVDLDIKFLFNYFDQKICIGTDHPEYNHYELREKFNKFSHKINQNKCENIAYKNIEKFFKLKI